MHARHQLSRRRFVTSGLAVATNLELQRAARALGLSASTTVCRLNAEQEVGPYYIAEELLRSEISEGKAGVPLTFQLTVLDARSCKPLSGAAVDLWHCDALGLYSGFTAMNPSGGGPGGPGGPPPPGFDPAHPNRRPPPPGFDPQHAGNRPGPPEGFGPPPQNHPTDRLTFLRGVQITDDRGFVRFETVFPGFYMGRTNHIHFKARVAGHTGTGTGGGRQTYLGGHTSHTGQVFFPEDLTTELMQREPYRNHTIHRTTQAEDNVYTGQHGALSIAELSSVQAGHPEAGLHAHLVAAVDPSATPAPQSRRPGPPA